MTNEEEYAHVLATEMSFIRSELALIKAEIDFSSDLIDKATKAPLSAMLKGLQRVDDGCTTNSDRIQEVRKRALRVILLSVKK